jgi:uncharacterized membrane protein YidH (DUF202 family)
MEGIILILAGILILVAAGFRWGWKFEQATKFLGKTGTTVFYVVCGVISIIVGILMIMGIID